MSIKKLISEDNSVITKHEIQQIPIIKIVPGPTNPRRQIDKDSIFDLAESMKTVGLIQAITVMSVGDKYEIISGERRYRAASHLKWKEISANVIIATDEQVLEIQLIENLQREDVSPIDEAAAFKSLLKKEKIDWLAAKIHKSKKYIADRLKLNDLTDEGKKYLSQSKLPLSHAVMISKLPQKEQEAAIKYVMQYDYNAPVVGEDDDKKICSKNLSELRNHIEFSLMTDFRKACFNLDLDNLVPGVCACSSCPKRTVNQNLLFDEITDEDKCTDAACYLAKEKAYIDLSMQAAKSKNESVTVLAGEKPMYSSDTIKVQGVELKFSKAKTKGREMIPVVITKSKSSSDRKELGKTVYISKADLEAGKQSKDVRKSTPQSETYEERRKRIFDKYRLPGLKNIPEVLTSISGEAKLKLIKSKILNELESINDVILISAAVFLGIHQTERSERDYCNIEGDFSERERPFFEHKKQILDKIIVKYSLEDIILIIALCDAIETHDGTDEVRTEEEMLEEGVYEYNYPEILQIINPLSDETKAVKSKKGKA